MAFPNDELDIVIKAYVGADPTADPGTWPTPVDWSDRLVDREVTIARGRRPGTSTAASGSCTFWLRDFDYAISTADLQGTPVSVEVDNIGASPPYGQFFGYVADVTTEVIRGTGGHEIVTAKVTLGGLLRQLTQGVVAKSALLRTITGQNITPPKVYWPMETEGGAESSRAAVSVFPSPIQGCPSLFFISSDHTIPGGHDESVGWGSLPIATWESYRLDGTVADSIIDSPAAATGLPAMTQGTLVAAVTFAGTTGKPAASTLVELDLADGGDYTKLRIGIYASTIDGVLSTMYGVEAVLVDEVTPATQTVGFDAPGDDGPQPFDGHPHQIWLVLEQDGSDVDMSLLVDGQLYTATATGVTLGVPTGARVGGGLTLISLGGGEDVGDGSDFAVSIGHVALWDSVPTIDLYAAMTGYAGEQAHDRLQRVFAEEGIPYTSTATESRECGPQPIADPVAVARDAELVDHGILAEDITTWGLTYRAGRQRYAQAARFTVDLTTYDVTGLDGRNVLRPVRNDQRLRNEWTISRPSGSSVTVRHEESISKRGRYNDAATVNVASDGQLQDEASWRVYEGIYDGRRWGSVPVDFSANPTLIPDWLVTELGDRVDRTGHPLSFMERLDVQGYTERLRRTSWAADLYVEPYAIFDTGTWGADVATATKRWDTLRSTLASSVDAGTDVTLSVNVADDFPLWTLDPDHWTGLLVEADGVIWQAEEIAGTSSPQTITVTQQPVNGVIKTVPAGTRLRDASHLRGKYGL